MPDLVNTDGETVAPSLTAEELETLADKGVEFDLSDDESEGPDGDDGEAVPDSDGDDSIDTEAELSEPEPGESGEESGEGDGEGSDSDGAEGGESGESEPGEPDDAGGSGSGDSTTDEETEVDGEPDDGGEAEIDETGDGDAEAEMSPDEIGGEIDEHEHTIEPDDDLIEDLESRDEEDELEDKFDVEMDEVHRVDERDIERWHQLVKSLNEYDTDIEQRKRERDERIENERTYRQGWEKIKSRAHNSGAVSELKEGFRELVSRPTPRPATAGPQIDPNNVVRRAAGDMTIQQLFKEQVEVETGERCVGLATDISGSMGSDINELKIAGGVIAEATEIIGDDFVWEAFTDRYSNRHEPSEERLDLRIVTGPQESFEWEHVDSFGSEANEPTAAGIRDCRRLMDETAARQNVMIVITDGVTLIEEDGTHYRNSEDGRAGPIDHTRRAVKECRQDGFDVIGLGIGGMDEEKMEEQFGTDQRGNPNYRLTTIDTLAEDILEIYKSQMSVTRR